MSLVNNTYANPSYNTLPYPDEIMPNIPPLLEIIGTNHNNGAVGLTPDGRTVTWMRSVQRTISLPLAWLGVIVGIQCGALALPSLATIIEIPDAIENHLTHYATVGMKISAFSGMLLGGVIASCVVPPISGAVNLVEFLLRSTRYAATMFINA